METALVDEKEGTIHLDDDDVDYREGDSLAQVFGRDAKLLNENGKEVQNVKVASSLLKPNRMLQVNGKRYSIKRGIIFHFIFFLNTQVIINNISPST